EIEAGDILLPQAAARIAEDAAELDGKVRIYAPNEPLPTAANRAAAASAGLTALQEVLQAFPKGVQDEVAKLLNAEAHAGVTRMPGNDDAIARTNVPPPPFRGSETSAQPVALPSLAPDDAPAAVAHRLIEDTDAALARQTLLQAASLPLDVPGARNGPTPP
nr:flagellar hook-length control protein FliK [Afipia sp.]